MSDITAIAELELILAVALPTDYRERLIRGDLTRYLGKKYWVVEDDWESDVDSLYSLTGSDSLVVIAKNRKAGKIPSYLLPIGDDGMAGTCLAIGISGSTRGCVFYIDTNDTRDGDVVGSDGTSAIASSFSRWIASLRD